MVRSTNENSPKILLGGIFFGMVFAKEKICLKKRKI